jgi:chromosome segregation ATPase
MTFSPTDAARLVREAQIERDRAQSDLAKARAEGERLLVKLESSLDTSERIDAERQQAQSDLARLEAENAETVHERDTALTRAEKAEAALAEARETMTAALVTSNTDHWCAVARAEKAESTLAAALKAKDEACDIAERLGTVTTTDRGAVYQYEQCLRITELRSVGKHWPDCVVNHGGSECDMGPECGSEDTRLECGSVGKETP